MRRAEAVPRARSLANRQALRRRVASTYWKSLAGNKKTSVICEGFWAFCGCRSSAGNRCQPTGRPGPAIISSSVLRTRGRQHGSLQSACNLATAHGWSATGWAARRGDVSRGDGAPTVNSRAQGYSRRGPGVGHRTAIVQKNQKKIEFTAIYKEKEKKTPVLPLKQNPKLTGFGGESGGTPTPKDRS